jgi:flagellar motor switch protein FliM
MITTKSLENKAKRLITQIEAEVLKQVTKQRLQTYKNIESQLGKQYKQARRQNDLNTALKLQAQIELIQALQKPATAKTSATARRR